MARHWSEVSPLTFIVSEAKEVSIAFTLKSTYLFVGQSDSVRNK